MKSTNVIKNIQRRESVERTSVIERENFISSNYFNSTMLSRMKVDRSIQLHFDTVDDLVNCITWSPNGQAIACGRIGKGAQVFNPFNENYTQGSELKNSDNHILVDCIFVPYNSNLLAVATQRKEIYNWGVQTNSICDEYVKLYDIEAKSRVAIRSYKFTGACRHILTTPALPNCIWFNIDMEGHTVAEADTREKDNFRFFRIKMKRDDETLNFERSMDISSTETMFVIGSKSEVSLFDRRMISQMKCQPFKTLKLVNNGLSPVSRAQQIVTQVKFHPYGKKILVTHTRQFHFTHHFVSIHDDNSSIESLEFPKSNSRLPRLMLRNPSFLGPAGSHVLLDVFFQNYSIVFDCKTYKYIGKIKFPDQNSSIYTQAHPHYCVIAASNQNQIKFFTPSG